MLGFPRDSDGKESATMQETQVWSLGWKDPLEKEMATHSSILTLEIPWAEEPGRLRSMGLQKSRTWLNQLNNSKDIYLSMYIFGHELYQKLKNSCLHHECKKLWTLVMTRQCWFMDSKKRSPLVWNIDHGEGCGMKDRTYKWELCTFCSVLLWI